MLQYVPLRRLTSFYINTSKAKLAGVALGRISAEPLPALGIASSSRIAIQDGVWSGHKMKSVHSMSAALSTSSCNTRLDIVTR
jgi:hypothetical protein